MADWPQHHDPLAVEQLVPEPTSIYWSMIVNAFLFSFLARSCKATGNAKKENLKRDP